MTIVLVYHLSGSVSFKINKNSFAPTKISRAFVVLNKKSYYNLIFKNYITTYHTNKISYEIYVKNVRKQYFLIKIEWITNLKNNFGSKTNDSLKVT